MIEIQEMSNEMIDAFLASTSYGHLACSHEDQPYVVPIHFAYAKPNIYVYTTEGKKWDIIRSNPKVCLQVEDVIDNTDWRSVVIDGIAEQIIDRAERERAVKLILGSNPSMTPAISIRWLDDWIRENREVVYVIKPTMMTGRSTVKVKIKAVGAQPGKK